jgi:transcriptional regulator with XRE-family HTH domain
VTIGERVQKALNSAGLKPADLARKSGVGQGRISLIINGETPNPRADTISKLATALGVNVGWLLTGHVDARGEEGREALEGYTGSRISGEEQRLLDAWHHASEEIRRAALTMLENSAKEYQAGGGEGEISQAQNSA